MAEPINGFFAFPSVPQSSGESVLQAVEEINKGGEVSLHPWPSASVSGTVVVQEILRHIDRCSLFCADITGLNPNVLFELGYAIAKLKRIWIVFDSTLVDSRRAFDQFKLLSTTGYRKYTNHRHIIEGFYKDRPQDTLENTLFDQLVSKSSPVADKAHLFYLKSKYDTPASLAITEAVVSSALEKIIDDPNENAAFPLSWYAKHVFDSMGVIAHATSRDRTDADLHNARLAFVCGFAHGLGRAVQILAQDDFLAPLDYRDLVTQYGSPGVAGKAAKAWLSTLEGFARFRSKGKTAAEAKRDMETHLSALVIGEPVAEHESDRLVTDYFVETAAYREALAGEHTVFIGRKGTGKTANLLKLSAELRKLPRTAVCVIKPAAYEFESLVRLMSEFKHRDLKSYAIESFWKFIVYSEIASTLTRIIEAKPAWARSEAETVLADLVNRNDGELGVPISVRIERAANELLTVARSTSVKTTLGAAQIAISEGLHRGVLGALRRAIQAVSGDLDRIGVLIDNLDKAWRRDADIEAMSDVILGLLGAVGRMPSDLNRAGTNDSLRVTVALFLRADIFARVLSKAREPDKIVYYKMRWADRELLLRVIEERLTTGASPGANVWDEFFVETVEGKPVVEFIVNAILPRPRDMVLLVKTAIEKATNRRHARVEEADLIDARVDYSQWLLGSIVVENGIEASQLERVLYEFAGDNGVMSTADVTQKMAKAGVPESDRPTVLAHLLKVGFLGLEVADGEFRYFEDFEENAKITILADKQANKRGGDRLYSINAPFRPYLEITG